MKDFNLEDWKRKELQKINSDPKVKQMMQSMKLKIILDSIKKLKTYGQQN